MKIERATLNHINELSELMDQYRVFYDQSSDITGAHDFLEMLLQNEEAIVFIAREDGRAIGFTLLYPTFSSVSLQQMFILNDLFVLPANRKKGVGQALLLQAKEFCREKNGKGVALATAVDNPAQKLYERNGWVKSRAWFYYFWAAE